MAYFDELNIKSSLILRFPQPPFRGSEDKVSHAATTRPTGSSFTLNTALGVRSLDGSAAGPPAVGFRSRGAVYVSVALLRWFETRGWF
jgi:hypothetical protein